jgi:deoxyadenosine/deoxycytidine kinase
LFKKIEKNTKEDVFRDYFASKKTLKKSNNSIHLDDLVNLKGKADELKERLKKKGKKLAKKNQKKA